MGGHRTWRWLRGRRDVGTGARTGPYRGDGVAYNYDRPDPVPGLHGDSAGGAREGEPDPLDSNQRYNWYGADDDYDPHETAPFDVEAFNYYLDTCATKYSAIDTPYDQYK